MQKNETLNVAFYIIIFILIVGGVYYLMNRDNSVTENPQENNNVVQDSGDVETDLPEGVEIVERDGERILRDERYGYEVDVDDNDVVEEENGFSFYDPSFEHFPMYTVRSISNDSNFSLEKWIQQYHEENFLLYYEERELLHINGEQVFKIKNEGAPENYSFYLKNDNQILIVSEPADSADSKIMNSFNLIQGGYEENN